MTGDKVVNKGIRVKESLWKRFLDKVYSNHGKTSGGAISESVEEALELWLRQK